MPRSEVKINKDNILYGIIGLLAGVIIGYLGTNSINRSEQPAAGNSTVSTATQPSMPPDHPPTGGGSASAGGEGGGSGGSSGSSPGGMQAEVAQTITTARNEPGNFEAQMKAAALFVQVQRYDQALGFYERAYKVKPDDFNVLASLGNVTFDLERFSDAERWYGEALRRRPDDVDIRTDLGLTYYLRKPPDLDKAIATFRESLARDPRHEKTLQNLITALLDKGDTSSARKLVQDLEKVNSANNALPQFRARLGS